MTAWSRAGQQVPGDGQATLSGDSHAPRRGAAEQECRAWEGCPARLQLRARRAQVEELLERGVYDMKELAEGGWLTALRYEDEVIADLKKRTGGKASKVRAVRRGSLLACLQCLSRLLHSLSCRPGSHTSARRTRVEENYWARLVAQVGLKKYASVSPSAFGLVGRKRIAVIRSAGAIVGGASCANPSRQPC